MGEINIEIGQPNLEIFAQSLLDLAQKDRDILVVTSDSRGSGKLTKFGEIFTETNY